MLDEIDKRLADVGSFIRGQREVASMSVRRLAELAGVSNPYLSQIERGLRRPSAEILQQIAKGLQISAETLYVRAGLMSDQPSDDHRVRDAISGDAKLSPEQRKALLNVYESFVGSSSSSSSRSSSSSSSSPGARRNSAKRNPDQVG